MQAMDSRMYNTYVHVRVSRSYAHVSRVYAVLRVQDQGYTWCRFIFEKL